VKTQFRNSSNDDPAHTLNLTEIGADLAAEANQYFKVTEDVPDMTGAEMSLQLSKMLDTDTIEFLLQQGELGKGILIGIAAGIFMLERTVDQKIAAQEAFFGVEELDDDQMEKIILDGLRQGRYGGKADGESEQ